MNISNEVGTIASIYEVTVRLYDYRSQETVGSRGIIPGAGENVMNLDLNFNGISEIDSFIDILLSARKQLTIQDSRYKYPWMGNFLNKDDSGKTAHEGYIKPKFYEMQFIKRFCNTCKHTGCGGPKSKWFEVCEYKEYLKEDI